MVSNVLWRGMQASARTLPRTCARSPVLASSGRRVYMCPGAVYAARVHMCPGAVCAARVCEKRAILELASNALWRSMQTSARTLPRTCARSLPGLSGLRVYMCPVSVGSDVCAFVWRMVWGRAYACAHVRPRTLTCLCRFASGRSYAPTHVRPLVFPGLAGSGCACVRSGLGCMRLCAAHGAGARVRSRVRAPSHSHMFVL